MKSTMKSTFAIIAVVLMVLVAVVPMVGVFTETSDAVVVTDPASANDAENKITLTVKLYDAHKDAKTTAEVGGGFIKITYLSGKYVWYQGIENAATGAVFTIYESSVDKVDITFVDADKKEVSDYPKVTISDLVGGLSYTADLIAGHYYGTATFKFASNEVIGAAYAQSSKITAKYEIYLRTIKTADPLTYDYKKVDNGDFALDLDGDGCFVGTAGFTYLAGLPAVTGDDKYVISVTSFSGMSGVTFSKDANYQIINVTEQGQDFTFTANEKIVEIAPNINTLVPLEITSITGKKGESGNMTFTAISKKLGPATDVKAVYTYVDPAVDGNYTLSVNVYDGKNTQKNDYNDVAAIPTTYTVNNAFFGTVTMDNLDLTQAGKLNAKIAKPETGTVSISNLAVDSNGIFFTFVKDADIESGDITEIKFDDFAIDDAEFTGAAALEFEISDDGYSEVSGVLYVSAATAGNEIAEKALKVAGGKNLKTFGPLTTAAGGIFKFAATTSENIIFTVDNAKLSGDVSVVAGPDSDELSLIMSTQDFSLKVQDAIGNNLAGVTVTIPELKIFDANYANKTYTGKVRADVDLTKYDVNLVKAGYTFEDAKYAKDKVFKANDAEYKFGFYSAQGALLAVGTGDVKVYESTVYKNSVGAFIYDKLTEKATAVEEGLLKLTTTPSMVSKSESDVGTSKLTAYVIYPEAAVYALGIFEPMYFFTVDDKGVCKIMAASDYLSASLTRINETTPISGIKVELSLDDFAHVVDTAYTQADGSFTLYSDAEIAEATAKVRFTDAYGYDFADSEAVYNAQHERKEVFTAAKDAYEFAYLDEDGKKISLTGVTTTINAEAVAANYAWEAGDEVAVAMTKAAAPYRTFETYVLTDADVASGEITFVSEQSKCTITAVDGIGLPLEGVEFTFYVELDGVTYSEAIPATIPALVAAATDEDGKSSVILTNLLNEDLVNAKVTGFALVPTLAGYDFSEDCVDITSASVSVEAPNTVLAYTLRDAAGNALAIASADYAVNVYDGSTAGPAATKFDGYFTLIGSPNKAYKFTVTNNSVAFAGYHFEAKSLPVLGAILANEQVVFGDIVDAAGDVLAIPAATTVKAYDILGNVIATSTNYVSAEHYYTIIVDVDEVAYYKPTANIVIGGVTYTFTGSVSPYINANEQTVEFSAITANGHDLVAAFENTKAFDSKGVKIGSSVAKGVVVDVDEVAYFQADVTVLGYTFAKQSATPVFVANESYITGSVPYTGKAGVDQAVELDFYLDGNLVDWKMAEVVEGYEYNAIVDLSGMVVDGVAFDSIAAIYTENGVVIASGVIDPTTPVNNIISPTVEIYVAELLPPSALIANHVAIEQIGVTVTVTADSNFMIADDEGVYTDGQYTYTFAGWYVDNQKVSTSPVFTFELTDDVVISPQYTVTYEKTSDANDKQTPQPQPVQPDNSIDTNVLIIGICAVIVALIAVVYAVIKKE